jgi:hypothetical protein
MKKAIPGNSQQAIVSLRNAVNRFLTGSGSGVKDIDVGAVLYSTNVFAEAGIADAQVGAPAQWQQIKSLVDGNGPSGDTATGAAIARAASALAQQEDFGRNILLVSDGEPCCTATAFNDMQTAANNAFAQDIRLMTIEIRRFDSTTAFHDALLNASGQTGYSNSASDGLGTGPMHFHVDNTATLDGLFDSLAHGFTCHVTLPSAPREPDWMGVALRNPSSGAETNIRRYCASGNTGAPQNGACNESVNALSCPPNGSTMSPVPAQCLTGFRGFRYESATRRVIMSMDVCTQIRDNGQQVVVRRDRPYLVIQ